MNWKKHLSINIIISVIFVIFMNDKFGWYDYHNFSTISQIILIILISPLILDIDHKKSILNYKLRFISFSFLVAGLIYFAIDNFLLTIGIGYWIIIILAVILFVLSWLFSKKFKHRGFIHSILFCLLFGVFIYILTAFSLELSILALIGSYSHLICDKKPFKLF